MPFPPSAKGGLIEVSLLRQRLIIAIEGFSISRPPRRAASLKSARSLAKGECLRLAHFRPPRRAASLK